MKKQLRSPKKLALDNRKLQPVPDDQLQQVAGGHEYLKSHPRRPEY